MEEMEHNSEPTRTQGAHKNKQAALTVAAVNGA